jgi:hypothetical protein
MKMVPPGTVQQGLTSGANLTYYGGPVLQNIKVYSVNWNSSVNSAIQTHMAAFYGGVTNSAYFDWLTEYNTTSPSQSIGEGSFGGSFTLTPSTKGSTIDDTAIQSELKKQISSGALPQPDSNSYYAINFPKGITITQGGQASCQVFCAYHGTLQVGGQNVYYGVLPSMESGTGCDLGCGGDANYLNNTTSVASHEMIETVTDGAVGLATKVGPPLAWYDQNNGEIGDICNAQQGSITGSDGQSYVIQLEWSNKANSCIATKSGASTGGGGGGNPTSVNVAFQVDSAYAAGNQNVYVTGDAPELGAWDPTKALALNPTNYPSWTGSLSMAVGETVNFKFALIDDVGNVTLEGGANRQLTVSAGQSSIPYDGTWQQ